MTKETISETAASEAQKAADFVLQAPAKSEEAAA